MRHIQLRKIIAASRKVKFELNCLTQVPGYSLQFYKIASTQLNTAQDTTIHRQARKRM